MQRAGGYGDSAGSAGTVRAGGTHAANWCEIMLREDSISESAVCVPLCGLIMH